MGVLVHTSVGLQSRFFSFQVFCCTTQSIFTISELRTHSPGVIRFCRMHLVLWISCMFKAASYTFRGLRATIRSNTAHPFLRRIRKMETHQGLSRKQDELLPIIVEQPYRINDLVEISSLHGTIITRVIPKAFEEFQLRKPPYPLNPCTLYVSHNNSTHQEETLISSYYKGGSNIISVSAEHDSANTVVIDVFLNNPTQRNTQEDTTNVHMHMKRAANEMTHRTLQRLETSLARKIQHTSSSTRKVGGKDKKSSSTLSSSSFVFLHENSLPPSSTGPLASSSSSASSSDRNLNHLASQMANAEMWLHLAKDIYPTSLPHLLISYNLSSDTIGNNPMNHSILLKICPCPPTLLSIKTFENFEGKIFTKVPIVIETDLIYATHAIITWFIDDVEILSNSNVFIPTEEHVGCKVSVHIRPVRPDHNGQGYEEAYTFRERVEKLPFMPIVDNCRRLWTMNRRTLEEKVQSLRVVSYNILADLYASREMSQYIMFAHCDPTFLDRKRRFPMIVAEILAYDTDIICLQEVDGSIYDSLLRPVFEAMGYQGYYTNKISIQKEGCAMFWSLTRFEAADESHMNSFGIRDLFTSGEMSHWDMTGIHQLLSKKDELRQVALEKTGQVLQCATLKPKYIRDDEHLPERMVLANTHLFYHPMADHVRALQAYVVARKIDQVRCSNGSFHAPFILCGDLNSDPLSGAAQLLLTSCVRPEHRDCWKNLKTYKWEMGESEYLIEHQYVGNRPDHTDLVYEEEAFQTAHGDLEYLHEINNYDDDTTPPIIQLPDTFPTIISGCREMPIFTNYAVDFKETLDYALASTIAKGEPYGFISKNCALMPSVEEVASYIAMPNECMPSDHVAILCDFEWTSASSSDRLGI